MKELRFTRQYKKDLKRYLKQPKKLEALKDVLEMLRTETPLPIIYKSHKLTGDYKGCLECHIESDFLLIWIDEKAITLFRLGTHSELFG